MSAAAPRTDLTTSLAGFVAKSRWEDVPSQVRHEAKRSLLNFFGTAIGGSRDGAVETALGVMSAFAGPGAASLIGRRERLDGLTASFLNAAAGNVFDFDDTHVPTVIHPTAPVAPPLLALAETRRIRGADLLHAFVLGVDVACRLGNAVSPGHYRRGWHITSTCGVFGAAAAAGKLLGLDARRLTWALGGAAAQSSGLVETLGTMAKSVGVGQAARGGLLAALLAQDGLTGPDQPIEGPRGFASVMSDGADLPSIVERLGERWEILANSYKPYPCGVVLNAVIDACLALRSPGPEEIRRIVVRGHPLLAERTDRPAVTTGREAQVSAQHSVAVALLFGAAGVAEYGDDAVADPAVLALRAKVTVERDAAMAVGAARVRIELASGESRAVTVEQATGSLERPLSDAAIEAKLRALARHGCPGLDPGRLIDAVWSMDRSDDVGQIMRLAVPPGRGDEAARANP
jgi:2-methylcitrate dehydratase PrpD